LSDRKLGASDTADDRPLAFILDGSGYDAGKVLRRGEGDTVIVAAVQREGSAFVEVNLGFEGAEVFG
jgi:hypothetical protein